MKINYKEWDYTLILVALMFLVAVLASCTDKSSGHRTSHLKKVTFPITIGMQDTMDDGRITYYVDTSDSTGLDNMYPEEIALSLKRGYWIYDEDVRLTK
jgi:hypothetical protein